MVSGQYLRKNIVLHVLANHRITGRFTLLKTMSISQAYQASN